MNPLALSAQAIADATGKIAVALPAPSLGTWWQAAIVVPTAPTGAQLALYLAGSKELAWIGPQPSAAVVILPGQVIQVDGSGFTAGQLVSVNLRGGWASGNAQGIAPAGPSSFTANTLTGKVTANITGPVTIASGTVDLGAGTKVGITGHVTLTTGTEVKLATGTEIAVSGASAVGQTAPTFTGRTVSASSTANIVTSAHSTWVALIPAPGAGHHIELHALSVLVNAGAAMTVSIDLSSTASATGRFMSMQLHANGTGDLVPYEFDFQGATLGTGLPLYINFAAGTTGSTFSAQLNYAIR